MTMWGGRFSDGPSEAARQFTVSTADRRLLEVDIRGSIAHVAALGEAGLLDGAEVEGITTGLGEILEEARRGAFAWQEADEDVHSAVERRLGEIIGPAAGKLHTGRSRNDQVALDVRLYLADAAAERITAIGALALALTDRAESA